MSVELLMEELRDLRDSLDRFRVEGLNLSTLRQFVPKCDESSLITSMTPGSTHPIDVWALSQSSWGLLVLWLCVSLGTSFRLFWVLEALGLPKTTVSTFLFV